MNAGPFCWRSLCALLALTTISTSAPAQIDPIARGLSVKASKDQSVRERINRLKRAARQAAAANPESSSTATGVTMTVASSADASLTNIYPAGPNAGLFVTSGGRTTSAGGSDNHQYLYFPVASLYPASNGNMSGALTTAPDYSAWGWSAAFATDSDKVEIRLGSCTTCQFRIQVDGHYVTKAGTSGINYVAYVELDFAGVRQPRTIKVEASDVESLRGVAVRPTSNIWRPAEDPERIVVLATGDSYSEGQGASSPGLFGWPQVLGRLMGWSDVRQVAVGGTGYLNPATALNRSKISAQISRWFTVNNDLSPQDVDVVLIAAGYNDYPSISGVTYTPTQIADEALSDWRLIRARMPQAMVVVMGPHAGVRGPDTRTIDIENALYARFRQWHDSNSLFIPLNGTDAGSSSWVFGTGRVGATNGSGNSDMLISADGVHPSDAGHLIYARRAAAAIRAELSHR